MTSRFINAKSATSFMVDDFMRITPVDDGSSGFGFSVVLGELDGRHSRRINRSSRKSYFIIEGTATFYVDDSCYIASGGDCIYAEPNSSVEIVGNSCRMYIICAPPFSADDETIS